jgi:hypothetical protein
MQSDLFTNILFTSPFRHNEGTFNLKTQLGLAIRPPSGTLLQAKTQVIIKILELLKKKKKKKSIHILVFISLK